MEKKQNQNQLQKTSLQNTDSTLTPMDAKFNMNILKMKMNDIVEITLEHKPTSIFKSYKHNEEKTIDLIMLMLIKFQEFFNCKSKMNKEQLLETSHIIVQQFRHFNYYDIALCLKEAKINEKIYDRIDGNMILEWLTKHDITRTRMIVTKREQQKAQQNAEWSALGERTSEQTIKSFIS